MLGYSGTGGEPKLPPQQLPEELISCWIELSENELKLASLPKVEWRAQSELEFKVAHLFCPLLDSTGSQTSILLLLLLILCFFGS